MARRGVIAKAHLAVVINRPQVALMVGTLEEKAARKAAEITKQRIRGYILAAGRVNTGRMLNSVNVRKRPSARGTSYRVSVDVPYYKYQNFGVRAHGPVTAKALVFTPKGASGPVFAKWVKGFEGGHFSEKARRDLSLKDFL